MAIRINRNGETIYGQYSSGDVIINLPPNQENLLLEGGIATLLEEGELQIVLAGSGGSSGGGAGGGGSDMTAAVYAGGVIASYTAGAEFVITRDGNLVPLTIHLAGDVTLKSDLTHVGGGYYIVSGGLKFVSGALQMTLAQRNTWLAITPTIAPGFRIFLSDVGVIVNESGVSTTPGAFQVYAGSGLGFLYESWCRYAYHQAGTSISGGGTLPSRTVVIPATVVGNYSNVRVSFWWLMAGGAGTRTCRVMVNGTQLFSTGALSSAQLTYIGSKSFFGNGSASQYASASSTLGDTAGASTAGYVTLSINMQTTDLTVVFDVANTSPDTTVLSRAEILIQDKLGLL